MSKVHVASAGSGWASSSDPKENPTIELILADGEQVLDKLEGMRPEHGCSRMLNIIFTFGLYYCLHRELISSVLITNYRVILFERFLNAARDTVTAYTQTSFFNNTLAGGKVDFKNPPRPKCIQLALIKMFKCLPCCRMPLATAAIRLQFVRYATPAAQEEEGGAAGLGAGGEVPDCGRIFSQVLDNILDEISRSIGIPCKMQIPMGYAFADTQGFDLVFAENISESEDPMAKDSPMYRMNVFFMHLLENSGVKGICKSSFNEKSLVFADAGQQASDPNNQVVIDRRIVATGRDELLIDGLNAVPSSLGKLIKLYVLSAVTLGIYYLMYLFCIPYEKGFVALTDRRFVSSRFIVKGARGTVTGGKSDTTIEFWMLDDYAQGSVSIIRGCCALSCLLRCFCLRSCCQPAVSVTLKSKKGPLNFNPEALVDINRITEFVKASLNVGFKPVLTKVQEIAGVSKDVPEDMLLLEDERVLVRLTGERISAAKFITNWILWIFTAGLFPFKNTSTIAITTARIISLEESKYCCFPCCLPVASTQEFYPLKKVTRVVIKKDRLCGLGNCFSFGKSHFIEAQFAAKGGKAPMKFDFAASAVGEDTGRDVTAAAKYLAALGQEEKKKKAAF